MFNITDDTPTGLQKILSHEKLTFAMLRTYVKEHFIIL